MEDLATSNNLSTNSDDQRIAENIGFIKQERYEDYSSLKHGYVDINKVKEEYLTSEYDSLENYTRDEYDIDIKDELEENLLRTSNTEGCTTTVIDPKRDVDIVTEEVLSDYYTPVVAPLANYTKVEGGIDIKNELENNLIRAANSECSETGESEISTTQEHLTNVNPIEKLSANIYLSEQAELTSPHREGRSHRDATNNTLQPVPHHKSITTGKKSNFCKVCHKSFISSYLLARHKRTHTVDKSYVCDVCHRAFIQSQYLEKHKRTHTSDRSYVCNVCHRMFNQPQYLEQHKRTHTDKLYVCDVCQKSFSASSSLDTHKRTHTGENSYFCDVCHKTFSRSSSLVQHKRTHACEKAYVCSVCRKAYSRLYDLEQHKRTHTIDELYICDVCPKAHIANI